MAMKKICDMCGAVKDEIETKGLVVPVDYCTECAVVADAYLFQVDSLHEQVVGQWDQGLDKIRKQFTESHPNMVFPDA